MSLYTARGGLLQPAPDAPPPTGGSPAAVVGTSNNAGGGLSLINTVPAFSTGIMTACFYLQCNGVNSNITFFADDTGNTQAWWLSTNKWKSRYNGKTLTSGITMVDDFWYHITLYSGVNFNGTHEVGQVIYSPGVGQVSAKNATSSNGAGGFATTAGRFYAMGDDNSGGLTDHCFIGKMADLMIADGYFTPNQMNIDASGNRKAPDAPAAAALITHCDFADENDLGKDVSGNGNHWNHENGVLTRETTNLPIGF